MHETKVKQNPMTRNWLWMCTCGRNGWGHQSKAEALKAGNAHASMSR